MDEKQREPASSDFSWQGAMMQKGESLIKGCLSLTVLIVAVLSYGTSTIQAEFISQGPPSGDRVAQDSITIADSIGETLIAGWPPARFSQDGTKVIVVVKKGNLEK